MKISVYLNPKVEEAYKWLRSLPGGFNLSGLVKQIILKTAKERGWKENKKKI